MPTKVSVNKRTVVHAKSDGKCVMFPDVCKVPAPPAPPIPTPLPDIGMSTDAAQGAQTVKADGQSLMIKGACFAQTSGDEAGSLGGMVSGTTKGKAEFVNYSFDVKVEGKPVPRLGDAMIGNKGNTPPLPEVQPPNVAIVGGGGAKDPNQKIVKIDWKK